MGMMGSRRMRLEGQSWLGCLRGLNPVSCYKSSDEKTNVQTGIGHPELDDFKLKSICGMQIAKYDVGEQRCFECVLQVITRRWCSYPNTHSNIKALLLVYQWLYHRAAILYLLNCRILVIGSVRRAKGSACICNGCGQVKAYNEDQQSNYSPFQKGTT